MLFVKRLFVIIIWLILIVVFMIWVWKFIKAVKLPNSLTAVDADSTKWI